ncbi:single-stranded DNA exonuclease [Acidithiobacillus thiooxidans]|nr:single-stranded DNA exonuclease [Acidithiobacillus albertensis]MBU2835759.1 single-stranded DNA exonuclease [Acidithiobacillus thiooxidans]MBU2841257.1 single-stranded DNA exonuclease [Acidithiobacillus thiooxidans]
MMPEPIKIIDRPLSQDVFNAAVAAGYTPLQSRIIAGRLGDEDAGRVGLLVRPPLSALDPPDRLPDINVAAEAVARAVKQGLPLILLSDFDCDGASGHAVLKFALRDYFGVPEHRIHSYIGHRLREGYGVSESVTQRILDSAPRPALVITADQGSSDHDRIKKLRDHGLTTIVTDHHGVPEQGPPHAAIACVNPVRTDSSFADPYIAGVHVAWLLCCAVRQKLIDWGHLPANAPRLGGLLDLVALGTMADCVDLARSANNRAVLTRGLALMNVPEARPVWRALYKVSRCSGPITAATLSFTFGPIINARGRLDCALGAVDLLMCDDEAEAIRLAHVLVEHNSERKRVQSKMLRRILPLAEEQAVDGAMAITVFDPEGHPGVHGVCAARLVEAYGRPAAYFSPKQESEHITASLRTVPGFHIRNALAGIAESYPDDFVAWGGHAGAGGVTLKREGFDRFATAFNAAATRALAAWTPGPRILSDGALEQLPSLELLKEFALLEPFGRQWEAPVFCTEGQILSVRPVGDGTHLKLLLGIGPNRFDAIWFGAVRDGVCPVETGQLVRVTFELEANTFRDETSLQLRVRHAVVIAGKPVMVQRVAT